MEEIETNDKLKYVRAILLTRAKIVEIAKEYASKADRDYYEGKMEGYLQAIDLLNENFESLRVELEGEGGKISDGSSR